jgi:hypothetical protein
MSSALFAFRLPVCDRTLRPFPVGGPFPCQRRSIFNPARPPLTGPVKMPSLRESDRYFWGRAFGTATTHCNCLQLNFWVQILNQVLNPEPDSDEISSLAG